MKLTLYHYNEQTLEFESTSILDPYIEGTTKIPGYATKMEPPLVEENKVAVFNTMKQSWVSKVDFRGVEYFDDSGKNYMIVDIGVEVPAGATVKTRKQTQKNIGGNLEEKKKDALYAAGNFHETIIGILTKNNNKEKSLANIHKLEAAKQHKSNSLSAENRELLKAESVRKDISIDILADTIIANHLKYLKIVIFVDNLEHKHIKLIEACDTVAKVRDAVTAMREDFMAESNRYAG